MFWRKSLSAGGDFRECYAVLEKGKLDFFKKESDYVNAEDPLNKKIIKMGDYALETNYRYDLLTSNCRFSVLMTMCTVRSKFESNGNPMAGISQLMILRSEYDLKEAAKKYKFVLVPKVCFDVIEICSSESVNFHDFT